MMPSRKRGENTGLLVGCGFAAHILRAFLKPPDLGHGTATRVYVDDSTISVVADTAWGVAKALGYGLPQTQGLTGHQIF